LELGVKPSAEMKSVAFSWSCVLPGIAAAMTSASFA
jgi:hypothetical protein